MMQNHALREAVDSRLSPPLSDAEWEVIVEDGYLGDWELCDREEAVTSVVKLTRRNRAVYAARPVRECGGGTDSDEARYSDPVLERSISFYLWKVAQEEPDVKKFRDRVLQGELLPESTTEDAIERTLKDAETRGKREEALAFATLGRLASEGEEVSIPSAIDGEELARFGHTVTVTVQTAAMATCWINELGDRLATEYGWSPWQARWFLLTNTCPLVPEVLVETSVQKNTPASKLVLRIDPTTSPATVEAVYRRARTEMVGGKFHSQSDKHRLLAFCTWSRSGDDLPWKQLLADWNELVADGPDWQYGQESTFRRDALLAQRRLYERTYGEVTDANAWLYLVGEPAPRGV